MNNDKFAALAGIPVAINDDGTLSFGEGVIHSTPSSRTFADMAPVLLYSTQGGPDILYLMYRDVCRQEDRKCIHDSGLRYDITVIFPGKIGAEYIKTMGHYHPWVPGTNWTYPEIYQVLHGKAHFLMQKGGEVSGEVQDFVIADFEQGDLLLIPPFYGHVTVNPGSGLLVMANWVCKNFNSVYDPIIARKGMAYYNVEYKGQSIFIPNDAYAWAAKPRLAKTTDYPEFGLKRNTSIYELWREGADLHFLTVPQKYEDFWKAMGVAPGERQ